MDSLAEAQCPWKESVSESGGESLCVCRQKVIERRPLEIFFSPDKNNADPTHPTAPPFPRAGDPAPAPISAVTLSQQLLDAARTCVAAVIRIAGLMLN